MMPINRSTFLLDTALLIGGLVCKPLIPKVNLLGRILCSTNEYLTVLHTNDMHSRLEPFPLEGKVTSGHGGISARAGLIKQIRGEQENILLLDAGDIFQGNAYFDIFKGEPEIKAMNMMGYDACTLGNHDFDGGIENMALQFAKAKFAIVNCNYDFTDTPMENKVVPSKIFHKGSLNIGLLGVGIDLSYFHPDIKHYGVKYLDPIVNANKTATALKEAGCDFIICLSHLGDKYDDNKMSDEILAKECFDIDLIIGGHTHKFFHEPRKYFNKKGGTTLVNQAGWGGLELGRIDFEFSELKKLKHIQKHNIIIDEKSG